MNCGKLVQTSNKEAKSRSKTCKEPITVTCRSFPHHFRRSKQPPIGFDALHATEPDI